MLTYRHNGEKEEKTMYTPKMIEKMGEVYQKILCVMNKEGKDPYWQSSDRYPFKCIAMVLPRAIACGIPEDLNREIAELMDLIDVEDVPEMMEKPIPMELTLYFNKGKMKRYAKKG